MDIDKLLEDKETVRDEDVRISPRTGKPIDKKKSEMGKKSAAKKRELKYPKMSGNGKNSPVIGMNGYNLKEGDNTKYLNLNMEIFNMPNIDMDNVDEVQERLNEYFALFAKYDTKPTVAGMAMCLNGMDRRTLWCIAKDLPTGSSGYKTALPKGVALVIKKSYFLLENLYENYMQNGKINPVAGIFLGKNNYGYVDKTEHVVTPNTNSDEDYSADDIKKRYLIAEGKEKTDVEED